MSTNTQLVKFPLNDQIENKLNDLLNSDAASGFHLVSAFCPPIVDGNIYVVFVIQKNT